MPTKQVASKKSTVNSLSPRNTPVKDSVKNLTKTVLVVGDWVVDENWTVSAHQSPTATEPLGSHFRSIVARDAAVFSFCGAGRVARALYWMNRFKPDGQIEPNRDHRLSIYGLGIWAIGNGPSLRSFFRPGSTEGSNPYQLPTEKMIGGDKRPIIPNGDVDLTGIKLINLARFVDTKSKVPLCTTRIYRVFRTSQDGRLDMVQRIDWELPAAEFNKHGYREWAITKTEDVSQLLNREIGRVQIDAIVVKCLGKGVVSDTLVTLLKNRFPRADWFVSSKLGIPKWLKIIKRPGENRLKLLFLPQIPMANIEQVPEWFTNNGLITREAEGYIKNELIAKDHATSVIINPRGLSIIALNHDENGRWLHTHFNSDYDRLTERIGKASLFFASLVANKLNGTPFELNIMRALEKTLKWRDNEELRLSKGNTEVKETAYDTDFFKGKENELKSKWRLVNSDWETSEKSWEQSRKGLGIIKSPDSSGNNRYRFELWRGMSVIENYVALVETRRNAVLQLYNLARSFIKPRFTQTDANSSVSCLLVDAPGRGKTVLVRSLAQKLGISYLPFNITEMVNREDIINSFDVIVTTQARERGKPVLVFVDEIDAQLSNGPVFDLFLAPLEDGVYMRGGNRFRIDPCIWIFAGTKTLKSTKTKSSLDSDRRKSTKDSDFVSRLTNGEILLTDTTQNLSSQAPQMNHLRRLERVYVGVNMLQNRYRDLRYVTAEVLFYFYRVNPDVSMRKVRHFVDKIRDVEYAKVSRRNLPPAGSVIEEKDISQNMQMSDIEPDVHEDRPIEISEFSTNGDFRLSQNLKNP
jgi:hypothetical protein